MENSKNLGRNPLALAKAAANTSAGFTFKSPSKASEELWDDDESAEEEQSEKKKKGKTKGESPGGKKKTKKMPSDYDDSDGDDETKLKPEFAHPLFGPWNLEPLVLQVPELDENREGHEDDNESLQDHLAPIRTRCELKSFQVPAASARYLGMYQREGVLFMFRTVYQNGGGILGDDMGTGTF